MMGYLEMRNGLYLLKRRVSEKGVDHYGVGVAGNWVLRLQRTHPVVVHLMPSSLQFDWWNEKDWTVVDKSRDSGAALDRLKAAIENKAWDLFSNNCEQFARAVVTGKRESRQLQGAVAIAGLAALAVLALRSEA
jgi:hypothetical protein